MPRNTHLARGGDHEVQPINRDVDSNAHASEVQVALAQNGEQGFVGSLAGERMMGAIKTTRIMLPGVNKERGGSLRGPRPTNQAGTPSALSHSLGLPQGQTS